MCEGGSKACIASGGCLPCELHLLWDHRLTACMLSWQEGCTMTVLKQAQNLIVTVLIQWTGTKKFGESAQLPGKCKQSAVPVPGQGHRGLSLVDLPKQHTPMPLC